MLAKLLIIIPVLVALNFLLLLTSCNKVSKKEAIKQKEKDLQLRKLTKLNSKELKPSQLAPTGS